MLASYNAKVVDI